MNDVAAFAVFEGGVAAAFENNGAEELLTGDTNLQHGILVAVL